MDIPPENVVVTLDSTLNRRKKRGKSNQYTSKAYFP